MGNAISICFKKYATFAGRASRSEYWFFYLFYLIVYVMGLVVGSSQGSQTLLYVFILPIILPMWSVGVRRMHDTGKSGWFLIVPFYNLVLLCSESNSGTNAYGDL